MEKNDENDKKTQTPFTAPNLAIAAFVVIGLILIIGTFNKGPEPVEDKPPGEDKPPAVQASSGKIVLRINSEVMAHEDEDAHGVCELSVEITGDDAAFLRKEVIGLQKIKRRGMDLQPEFFLDFHEEKKPDSKSPAIVRYGILEGEHLMIPQDGVIFHAPFSEKFADKLRPYRAKWLAQALNKTGCSNIIKAKDPFKKLNEIESFMLAVFFRSWKKESGISGELETMTSQNPGLKKIIATELRPAILQLIKKSPLDLAFRASKIGSAFGIGVAEFAGRIQTIKLQANPDLNYIYGDEKQDHHNTNLGLGKYSAKITDRNKINSVIGSLRFYPGTIPDSPEYAPLYLVRFIEKKDTFIEFSYYPGSYFLFPNGSIVKNAAGFDNAVLPTLIPLVSEMLIKESEHVTGKKGRADQHQIRVLTYILESRFLGLPQNKKEKFYEYRAISDSLRVVAKRLASVIISPDEDEDARDYALRSFEIAVNQVFGMGDDVNMNDVKEASLREAIKWWSEHKKEFE